MDQGQSAMQSLMGGILQNQVSGAQGGGGGMGNPLADGMRRGQKYPVLQGLWNSLPIDRDFTEEEWQNWLTSVEMAVEMAPTDSGASGTPEDE